MFGKKNLTLPLKRRGYVSVEKLGVWGIIKTDSILIN